MAEWLRSGLQIRVPQFDSGRGLQIFPFAAQNCYFLCVNPNLTASSGYFFFSQAPSVTVVFRRHRLTAGISMERTINPRGTIQNPRIGRNPNTPPKISNTPMTIRANRLAGSLKVRPAIFIFGMVIQLGTEENNYKDRRY